MGFRNGAYATVWEVREGNGNYSDVRISISRKNKETGEYRTEFNAWVRMIGKAHNQASDLAERSRIRIGECDVTNKYDKEKNITYTNYAVFGFEDANGDGGETTAPSNSLKTDENGFIQMSDGIEDELPFA